MVNWNLWPLNQTPRIWILVRYPWIWILVRLSNSYLSLLPSRTRTLPWAEKKNGICPNFSGKRKVRRRIHIISQKSQVAKFTRVLHICHSVTTLWWFINQYLFINFISKYLFINCIGRLESNWFIKNDYQFCTITLLNNRSLSTLNTACNYYVLLNFNSFFKRDKVSEELNLEFNLEFKTRIEVQNIINHSVPLF